MAAAMIEIRWNNISRREINVTVEFQARGLICDKKRLKNYS
jgi:hypothetical protein